MKTEWYFQGQPGFGLDLWIWMKKSGWSVEALAKELGTSTTTIYAWRQGRVDPALKHRLALRSLAEKTGV